LGLYATGVGFEILLGEWFGVECRGVGGGAKRQMNLGCAAT
jgi:hypothetical protein